MAKLRLQEFDEVKLTIRGEVYFIKGPIEFKVPVDAKLKPLNCIDRSKGPTNIYKPSTVF